jgi:hypothetical protein
MLYDYDSLVTLTKAKLIASWEKNDTEWELVQPVALHDFPAQYAPMRLRDWLNKDKTFAPLVPLVQGKVEFLPDVQVFWPDVSLDTPEQAAALLQTRIESSRQPITLLGLTVDSRLALIVAPMSIAVASLYLLSLINMLLISMESQTVSGAPLRVYPWVGSFSDRLSLFVSVASMIVLPPVAASLLTLQYWSGGDVASAVAVTSTMCVIVLSCLLWRALRNLRQRFQGAVLPLTSDGAD